MYWLDHNQSSTNSQKVFYCDDESDIEMLPTSRSPGEPQGYKSVDPTVVQNAPVVIGSQCLVISTGEVYMLNSQDIWAKIGG